MDRLELMQIAVTAVDAGSLSAAARKLGLPLTTVSRKVAALERHLHTQLFTRATRRIGLTDAGTDYVLSCRRVLQDVREMERAAGGEYTAPKGDLWLTAPLVFGRLHVLPVVAQFLQAYPEVDVKLSLSDRVVNLLEEPVDLALRIGNLPDSSLVATRLGTIRQVTCASPDYLKRRGVPKNPEALAGHDCVTFEGLMSSQEWHFEVESYADETVRGLVSSHYYAVHVDRSALPDLSSRYPGYDQPTTVIFNSDGSEIVRLPGFRTADRLAALLQAVIDDPSPGPSASRETTPQYSASPSFPDAVLDTLQKAVSAQSVTPEQFSAFAAYYLDEAILEYTVSVSPRAAVPLPHSIESTLAAMCGLVDPVWGGIHQSLVLPHPRTGELQHVYFERFQVGLALDDTSNSWNEPHFEMPLAVQAQSIQMFSRAAALRPAPEDLAAAGSIDTYVRAFLTSPEGAFYAGQTGEVPRELTPESYYALDDAARRRHGLPDVDRHIYARENGWMISALCALYAVSGDPAVLEQAERAANWVSQHRALPGGGFAHGEHDVTGPYLGDSLALAEAFVALHRVTGDAVWLQRSRTAVQFIGTHFAAAGGAGFLATVTAPTPSYHAQPEPLENAQLASLAHLLFQYSGDKEEEAIAVRALRYLATPGVATNTAAAAVLLAHSQFTHPVAYLVVIGERQDTTAQTLYRAAVRQVFTYPRLEWREPAELDAHSTSGLQPFSRPAAYVCNPSACEGPFFDAAEFTRSVTSRQP